MDPVSGRKFAFVAALVMTIAPSVLAQSPDSCLVKSRSDALIVMVCRPGTAQEAMTQASRAACGSKTAMCNVWIWDNADKAPATAPLRDSDLPKDSIRHAVAVWANDAQSLMLLKQVVPK